MSGCRRRVRFRAVLHRDFALRVRRGGVFFRLDVVALIEVMRRFMVMMRGGMMMGSGAVMIGRGGAMIVGGCIFR